MSNARETIFSIAVENRTLRWTVLVLCVAVCTLAVVLVFRPAPPVWVIGAHGNVFRGETEILNWEPIEVSRRALEILFVPTEEREKLIDAFYSKNIRGNAKAHVPKDRFISFQIKDLKNPEPGKVNVEGVLQRVDKPSVTMTLNLEQAARTEMNPFGLVVAQGSFDEAERQ